MAHSEFTVQDEYRYDRSSPIRWIVSHISRYRIIAVAMILLTFLGNMVLALVPVFTGNAFNAVIAAHPDRSGFVHSALALLGVVLLGGAADLVARIAVEFVGKRVARDARDELCLSLLGKSQTFHNRQRAGDLMARAANDVGQLSDMIVPGFDSILDSFVALATSIVAIGLLKVQLLAAPLLFTAAFLLALRHYVRELTPVSSAMRGQFGVLNAGLAETVTGIEVVKASAQEPEEARAFDARAHAYRDLFVRSGRIQARYLPPLLLAAAYVGAFLHGVYLVSHHQLSAGGLVTYMGLMNVLRFPAYVSIFNFNLVALGIAASGRILSILREDTELNENQSGYNGQIEGRIAFENVGFSYGPDPVLRDVTFRAEPGQVVAIVGQTGAGKSTLVKLVNRIYDVQSGRVTIDGVDVRDWSIGALREQIATIEQDVFLYSRTIAENIAFGLGQQASRAAIEQAARDAQAHEFISGFQDGYDTVIGERGVTLSGGQRQRLAIARALLVSPRILILDDSTSAIDSATEDAIQQAMRRLLEGRTTLLITHRLSQIRTADWVLVLKGGALVDQGTHSQLLERSGLYRRIFAHNSDSRVSAVSMAGE